jgi:dipeptidyl aminopeptidase/acylaminoacyl peptidase
MKSLLVLFVLMGIAVSAQQPPLIDRDIFFGDPEISTARISPDGKYISFIKPFNGVRNIWVKEFDQAFEDARPITADTTRPIQSYFWSVNSEYILYVQDKGGDENFNIYAVDPKEKGDPVPAARNLTDFENVRAVIYAVPNSTPDEIVVGLNDRNPQLHDVYKLKLSDGSLNLLWKNEQNVTGWLLDLDANLRLGTRMTEDGGTEILKVDGDDLISIYSVTNYESAGPLRFTPDGKSFYMITNKGDDVDKLQLMKYHLEDDKIEFIEKDPMNQVDFGGAHFSDVTNELIYTSYTGDKTRKSFKDKEFENEFNKLKSKLPEGEVSITSQTEDEKIWLVSVSRDVDPGSVYVYDSNTGEVELLYKSRPELPSEHLANMKPVRYEARDGLEIPAYLTLPKGLDDKNLPTVLFIHGGPWARDYWGYDGIAQFLANRGYAVLQINFRGSTGFGKEFLNAGNKEWGRGAMQHDLTDAANWLIEEGIADPEKIAIAGGSYGGYATLAGLAFTPEIYAAGFDIVGPSNIITLLNSIPPYWEPIKKMFDLRVGDMDDPEELKMLQEQSPLNYAENITKPLYIVQGANDPRVKKAESDQMVVALRELGRDVEYMMAPDEGHGFAGLENRLVMIYAMEKFFAKHLDGRYQKDLSDELRKRYNEIKVDISTVTMPKKVDVSDGAKLMEFDGSKLNFGSREYDITVNTQGQEIKMSLKREISKTNLENEEVVRVIDQVSGMMAGADTVYLNSGTLRPIKRSGTQGMAKVTVNYTDSKIEGLIDAGPQKLPLNAEVDSPLFADGANVELGLETLPLAEGYEATFDQFDLMSAKVKTFLVKVASMEKANVGGTEYDTIKLEVVDTEDTENPRIVWVNKENNQVVKREDTLPPTMGGGKVVTTFVK